MQTWGIIIVILVLSFAVIRSSISHFVCSKCGKSFKVNFLKYIIAPHSIGKRLVKCPNCGHSEMMSPQLDKKKP